jgi:hypothetical protein
MIYIYGDSHANFSFKNLQQYLPCNNYHENSITMYRIGRDNNIINYRNEQTKDDIIIFVYGEVDCRCHVQRQIDMGRNEDDIINELVHNYFITIKNNITKFKKIVITGIIPPVKRNDFEILYGPILHEFPFIGTDEDRVRYTKKMNELLENLSNKNGYIYFNPYDYYTRPDGTLKYELSDNIVHIGENINIIEKIINVIGGIKY